MTRLIWYIKLVTLVMDDETDETHQGLGYFLQ